MFYKVWHLLSLASYVPTTISLSNLAALSCWLQLVRRTGASLLIWPRPSYRVTKCLLDMDSSGSTSEDAARAIAYVIRTNLSRIVNFKMKRGATDSGSGRTKAYLVHELINVTLATLHYRKNTCVTHNLQTTVYNAVLNCFGSWGSEEGKKGELKYRKIQYN